MINQDYVELLCGFLINHFRVTDSYEEGVGSAIKYFEFDEPSYFDEMRRVFEYFLDKKNVFPENFVRDIVRSNANWFVSDDQGAYHKLRYIYEDVILQKQEPIDIELAISLYQYQEIASWLKQGNHPDDTTQMISELTLLQDMLLSSGDHDDEPIMEAITNLLIKHGASVCIKDAPDNLQPLFLAVNENYKSITKLLLAHGASVDLRDDSGYTPLIHAVEFGDTEMVRLLATHASFDVLHTPAGHWAYSPLGLAFHKADISLIRVLLECGSDPYHNNYDQGKQDINLLPQDLDFERRQQIAHLVKELAYKH